MSQRPRVAVIGGGIIGSSVAWRLSREDARVTLLEREGPDAPSGPGGAGTASMAAAGMLAPLKEAEEPGPFMDLGLRSMERYPAFIEEIQRASGLDVLYRRDGRLDLALDHEVADALRRHREIQAAAGYESRTLEPDAIRAIEPAIGPEAVLGLVTDYDHQLDAQRLTRAVWAAAGSAGVEIRSEVEAVEVVIEGSRVRGVRLASGDTVPADFVVVAAGAWSGQLDLPLRIPVRPVRGQIVVLRSEAPILNRCTWGPYVYLVPRSDGRLLVGSTMEDVGFEAQVTAGAVARLLTVAARVAPAVAEAAVEGFKVGFRPATEDGLPAIGPDPNVEGLLYATGHFRNGILLAPETAEQVSGMILRDAAPEPAFDPARFAD